jgi:hypothetical protein
MKSIKKLIGTKINFEGCLDDQAVAINYDRVIRNKYSKNIFSFLNAHLFGDLENLDEQNLWRRINDGRL